MKQISTLANSYDDIDVTPSLSWVLQPYTTLNGIRVPVSRDGDFWLCALAITSSQVESPSLIRYNATCGIRISDADGYTLMSDFVGSGFCTPGNPFVIRPSHLFRAGTHISIDLQEQSGVNNVVQIAFRGRYRYRMSDVIEQAKWATEVKGTGL